MTKTFTISGLEWGKALAWMLSHECELSFWQKVRKKKPIKSIYYRIIPTHIGQAVHVGCEGCRKEFDVTDYDLW